MGGNILDEDFENPGYENSWSEDVTGGTIDDSNQDVARPTGGGDYVLRLDKVSGDYDAKFTWDAGSEQAVTYTTFYVQITAEGLANNQEISLLDPRNGSPTWNAPYKVSLRQTSGGDLILYFFVYFNGTWNYERYPDSGSISLDTWYRVDIKYDDTGGTWELRVNVDEWTKNGSLSGTILNPPKDWRFGGLDNYTVTAYFDLINIDSTGYVSFGAATQTLIASAIASLEALGDPQANFSLSPSAIASLEAHGTPQFNFGLSFPGIASAETFGSHAAQLAVQYLDPDAIASLEAHGTPQLNMALSADGIASSEVFGTTVLKLYLIPSSITTLEGFGTPDVEWRLGPSGIPSLEAFGSLSLALAVGLVPDGIGSSEGFGTPVFVKEIEPYTALSKEAFGDPELTYLNLVPTGIASLEVLGTPQVNFIIIGEAIGSGEIFGTLSLATAASIFPDAIASLETFGSVFLNLFNNLFPDSIASSEIFGSPRLRKSITPSGVTSLEALGDLIVKLNIQSISPDGIPSGEAFGLNLLISRFIRKAVAEAIGMREKVLRGSRTHSGGKDIVNIILSNIWETTSSVSTIWETTKKIQNDE